MTWITRQREALYTRLRERRTPQFVLYGVVSDDGLYKIQPSGIDGGPPRSWTKVFVKNK
jgi:hypothetical protein